MRLARFALVALTLLNGADAQERRKMLGQVVDADGKPIAGAIVHIWGRPIPWMALLELDRHEVTTDRRGRFRTEVLNSITYTVWAVAGKPLEDGRQLVTQVVEEAQAGRPFVLEAGKPRKPVELEIDGLDAWADFGPLAARVIPRFATHGSLPVPLDPQNPKVVIPPLPADSNATFEIVSRAGEPIVSTAFRRGKKVAVPAPVSMPFRVVDSEGAPVAGATIRYRSASHWSHSRSRMFGGGTYHDWLTIGTTGEDGTATLNVPAPSNPLDKPGHDWIVFAASKEGFADSHSGFAQQKAFQDGAWLKPDDVVTTVSFKLQTEKPFKGRLTLREDAEAIEGHDVVIATTCKIASENGWTHLPRQFKVRTDETGRFQVRGMPLDAYATSVTSLTPTAAVEAWNQGLSRPPNRPAMLTLWSAGDKRSLEMPSYALATLREVELTITETHGGPVEFAQGVVLLDDGSMLWSDLNTTPRFTVGSRGKIRLRVPKGEFHVFLASESGWKLLSVTDETQVDVALRPFSTMPIQVVDQDENAVGGATIGIQSSSQGWSDQKQDRLLMHIASRINRELLSGKTDDEGRITLRFIPCSALKYQVNARHRSGNSGQTRVMAADEVTLLTVSK